MVCLDCNGKGYVNDKRGDRVCQECDGHGEYPILKRFSDTFKSGGSGKLDRKACFLSEALPG